MTEGVEGGRVDRPRDPVVLDVPAGRVPRLEPTEPQHVEVRAEGGHRVVLVGAPEGVIDEGPALTPSLLEMPVGNRPQSAEAPDRGELSPQSWRRADDYVTDQVVALLVESRGDLSVQPRADEGGLPLSPLAVVARAVERVARILIVDYVEATVSDVGSVVPALGAVAWIAVTRKLEPVEGGPGDTGILSVTRGRGVRFEVAARTALPEKGECQRGLKTCRFIRAATSGTC